MLIRRIMIALGVALICAIVLVEYLNFSGFCYSERRYPSDAELIARAIAYNLERHSPDSSRSKMYASLDDFYRENPKCCEILRWSSGPFGNPLILRLFGVYESLVDIAYRINDGGGVDNFYGSMTIVNSCGKILEVRGSPMPENLINRK
jgi:hypothetical protein